jgi:hypothetical protein
MVHNGGGIREGPLACGSKLSAAFSLVHGKKQGKKFFGDGAVDSAIRGSGKGKPQRRKVAEQKTALECPPTFLCALASLRFNSGHSWCFARKRY